MTMPYDEYVADIVNRCRNDELIFVDDMVEIELHEFQYLLADAWMAGLMHAYKLIDEVKK